MVISILHPSRSRAELANKTFIKWLLNASNENEYEYFVSVDVDDPQLELYIKFFPESNLLVNNNRSIVDAMNAAAMEATGEMFVCVSDDFDPIKDWDKKLIEKVIGGTDYAILVNDGIQTSDNKIMTLPILSRSLYEKLGYVYFPGYYSMWVDNDITAVAKQLNCLIDATDLLFKHNHYTVTGEKPDVTYQRENSQSAYKMGEKLFKQRQLNNFGL